MDELEEIEAGLRRSLQHVPAPENFTKHVLQRVAEREAARKVAGSRERRRSGLFMAVHHRTAWWTAAAAALALSVGGNVLHERHQQYTRKAAAAQAQVDLAMQLTSHALNEVEIGLDRSPAGRFTQFLNRTQKVRESTMKQMFWKRTSSVASLALCMGATGARVAQGQMVPVSVTLDEGATQPGTSGAVADPQAKDDLLEGLDRLGINAKERNEVNLDKSMLALAGSKKGGHYADLAQKMDFIVVRNYEFASKGQYQKSDLDALRHRLEGSGWSHVVRNESDGETNDIVVKSDREGFISDMVILNAEAKELNIVHLRGRFRMEDVQGAMGAGMGAMGAAIGHMAAAPQQPAPPEPPVLKKH